MPRRKAPKALAVTQWTSLGWQTAEMMLASAHVIRHRLNRMAMAQFPLSPRDSAEFLRMGQEKAEAAAESLVALSTGILHNEHPQTLTRKVMKPFRTRAVANAKRLKKL
ncbi:hypothetical protein ABI_45390 [Asticcacaulis biprosthecium C19]|uniref:Uncharacterized protein n=1 Tax=Asticcacaulis biprosthecium C19 TaxID=715226 RepID=F4QTP2_9CAUL|nr:hypothetical protein [Asticcacaulis biprosthecium]EGF89192.1 hypothetical protein ABI_45390 [Asticcacaulis biprosthecium C19]